MTIERRAVPRVTLKAYGLNHVSRVRLDVREVEAGLIDISPAGARLRFISASDHGLIRFLDNLTFFPCLIGAPEFLRQLPCQVRWAINGEFGVQFSRQLPLGAHDLQDLLARKA